jgi:UDP-N-acetylglucosamine 4,6-dehydratase
MDKVVITGGSGMLGRALLARYANVHPVTAISRSEKLQLPLRAQYPQVTFLLGDIRDRAFLARACEGASVILHAAALKHVPLSELEPTAYISVNVHGSLQVLDVAHAVGAKVVGISTDKACAPRNVYGASKFLMERMLVEQGHVAIRYGNVFASDGSVVVRWTQQLQEVGTITVTDPEMTRFFFRIGDAVDAIDWAWHTAPAGTVVVPFLRAGACRKG